MDFPRTRFANVSKVVAGIAGSALMAGLFWSLVLVPMGWPTLALVGHYIGESMGSSDTYWSIVATTIRTVTGFSLGFGLAVVLALATGRSVLGWLFFFFALLFLQKLPAVAMVHVLVSSRLGIGFLTTVVLGATVVLTFSWIVLHHRAVTLNEREIFALRLLGFSRLQSFGYGTLPHLGSALGATARLGISIALIMVTIGEWQGVWDDSSIWRFGLGVQISRAYEALHSDARVLAYCFWLGVVGIVLDTSILGCLAVFRRWLGINFSR